MAMYNLLLAPSETVNPEFHWFRQLPALGYHLLPFKSQRAESALRLPAPVEVISDSEGSDDQLSRNQDSPREERKAAADDVADEGRFARRGPNSGGSNVFCPRTTEEFRSENPWMGFEEEDIVVIRPPSLADGPDGFWLGKILQLVHPNKIKVHWLDKKRQEMKWTDAGCKWEPQVVASKKPQTDTVDIDVVGFQVQLNKSGAFDRGIGLWNG